MNNFKLQFQEAEDTGSSSSASDEESTQPDFPTLSGESSGHESREGDIVWGKVLGFPWWPGKVSSTSE